ncbi:MAG TPA: bifunctional DNA-formamidopyrimidine glycosylase/DNA-(apurinic or apyrimidinic site) lyase [Chloroflexota bacterium]|nr:bifunctional DNA-formamidopyrimidine glycosylase/DNA-(apurinic or apyrimidinic site) lyase [Chloroflexota bacterium]
MPELPEVETTARGLRPRFVGRRVTSVGGVDWPRMLPNATEPDLADALIGHTVTSIDRRGKYLLIGFENDAWLSVHRKMSGNLLLQPAESAPPLHTHLEVVLDDGVALRFVDPRKFGRIHLFHSLDERDDFLNERLGPDSLVDFDARVLAEKIRGRRGRVKSLLLDQAFLAGVGNLYADEALWLSKIHPLRTADTLTGLEVKRLAEAIRQVFLDAIARRGTSFDGNYRDQDGQPGENQAFLNAYGCQDEPCPRCGTRIHRIIVGGRGTHFCPKCQKLPRH